MSTKPLIDPFELYSHYYDLIYRDKDYLKESEYVAKKIEQYKPGAKSLLELGSGTGKHAYHLCNKDYSITGIEKAPQLLELASAKQIQGFEPVAGDMVWFTLDKQFDAAISLFHVFCYLNKNEEIIACLQQVAKHLRTGGLFVFEVWYTPAVLTQKPEPRVKKIESELFEITRFAEPVMKYEANVVEVNYTMLVKNKQTGQHNLLEEKHCMRHFSTPEIKVFAGVAGFDLVCSEEFLSSKECGSDTWSVCYILKKYD